MTEILTAVFDGNVLRPDRPLDLQPNTRCVITVQVSSEKAGSGDAWDTLDQLAGSVEAPADWAKQHDHYLYGTPKRSSEGG